MPRKEYFKKIRYTVFWVVLILSFMIFGATLYCKANGFLVNPKTFKMTQTGIISVDGKPQTATIKINGKVRGEKLPKTFRDVFPGSYNIEVSAPGYQAWQRSVQVQPGRADVFENIVLFLEKPVEETTNLSQQDVESGAKDQSQDLKIQQNEIYFKDKLVTRFSQNITAAICPDNAHLFFEQNDEIRVIDLDGSNNKLLFKLPDAAPTNLFYQNNKTLYYTFENKVLAKTVN